MNINNPTTFASPNLTLSTSNSSGTSGALRADDTILMFDGTSYGTIASGAGGGLGSATVAARRDHGHPVNTFGDVAGPGSSTDNEIARQSGTGGKTLQSYTSLAPTISDNGLVLWPGQPLVQAYVDGTINNVTGAGTAYTVLFDVELADHTGAYNTGTGTFTAPATGNYMVAVDLSISSLVVAMTGTAHAVVTSNRTHWIHQAGFNRATAGGHLIEFYSIVVDMDINDTLTFSARIDAGAGDTADLDGSADGIYTQIGIWLIG